jgi:penicillin-binding protein 1C
LAREGAVAIGPKLSCAILVIDNASGEIRAHVGAADYFSQERAGSIDMTEATRSPGSTLKPFIYALAFESGIGHPETILDDRPRHYGGPARFIARLRNAGARVVLPDDTAPGLAAALGGLGITLRDLASLYAGLARGGSVPAPARARRKVYVGKCSLHQPSSMWFGLRLASQAASPGGLNPHNGYRSISTILGRHS